MCACWISTAYLVSEAVRYCVPVGLLGPSSFETLKPYLEYGCDDRQLHCPLFIKHDAVHLGQQVIEAAFTQLLR